MKKTSGGNCALLCQITPKVELYVFPPTSRLPNHQPWQMDDSSTKSRGEQCLQVALFDHFLRTIGSSMNKMTKILTYSLSIRPGLLAPYAVCPGWLLSMVDGKLVAPLASCGDTWLSEQQK